MWERFRMRASARMDHVHRWCGRLCDGSSRDVRRFLARCRAAQPSSEAFMRRARRFRTAELERVTLSGFRAKIARP